MDITFGGLGDLPDDLCGKMTGKGSLVDIRNVIDGGCSDLSKAWAERRDGQHESIANAGPMADLPPVPQKSDVDRQKIIREAEKLLMRRGSTDQLNQFLSLAFDGRPIPDDPQIQALYEEAGLLGNVFLDRRVFATCDEVKVFWKKYKNHYVDLLLASDACKGCALCIDRCPMTGLRVVEKIDYTPDLLSELRAKLAMAGKCSSDTSIETKEQLQEIFLSKSAAPHQRGVQASFTTPKPLNREEVTRKLTMEAGRREKERAQDARTLEAEKELRPMLRTLHELLLTGSDLSTIRRSFEQKGFPRENIEKYNSELRALLGDYLVRSGLKVVPTLYDRCDECKGFLAKRQSLRPELAEKFEKCNGCNHNNGVRCRMLSCGLINSDEVPPLDVRKIAIYNLKDSQLISSAEASQSEQIEISQPIKGIKMAFQLIDSRHSRTPARTAAASGQRPEMQLKRLNAALPDAVGRAAKALEEGMSCSVVEMLLGRESSSGEAETTVGVALRSLKSIDANQLDYCMARKYPVDSSRIKIVRSKKCLTCEYGRDRMHCAAQGALFSDDLNVSDDLTEANKEAQEVQSYFAGTEIKVEIDKKPYKAPLEIEIENAGKDLVVDAGTRGADPVPNILTSMQQGAEMPVEIDPPQAHARPLKIEGLNPGFDIDV